MRANDNLSIELSVIGYKLAWCEADSNLQIEPGPGFLGEGVAIAKSVAAW